MKRIILGFLLGCVVTGALCVAVLISQEEKIRNWSREIGRLDGLFEAADAIDKEFGRYDGKGEYKRLFGVKTTDVIAIETNGVKTVRIIP